MDNIYTYQQRQPPAGTQDALSRRSFFVVMVFTFFVHACAVLFFHDVLVPAGFIIAGLCVVLIFFGLLCRLQALWGTLPVTAFQRRLFIASLLLRVAATVGLYYFYLYTTGEPFEFNAVDSIFYHEHGQAIALRFSVLDFDTGSMMQDLSFSDKGYNIYLGFIYAVFGNHILIPRLINTLLSAATVILIYRIAKAVFGEGVARIAGIMAMLLPNFLLYQGTHMKETVMIFISTAIIYKGIQLIGQERRTFTNIALLAGLLFVLFTLRTMLAVVLSASFLLYAFLYRPPRARFLNMLAVIFLSGCFLLLVINSQIGAEIAEYYEKSSNSLSSNMQFRATRDGGNKFALLAGAPLLLSLVIMAPFPSWVYVPLQDFLWMFTGANLIRNIYAFFVISAVLKLARKDLRKVLFLLAFTGGYFVVLAQSGLALSERFQLPVVPVLVILAAYGIYHVSAKGMRYFEYYLAFITILILAWNYIKILGRL